jgi:hypothetical protein
MTQLQAAEEVEMSVVSFALALAAVPLVVVMFAYLLARTLLLVDPPGARRHRRPMARHL